MIQLFGLQQIANNSFRNHVESFAAERMATWATGRTAFLYSCGSDAFEERAQNVYPWISSYSPPRGTVAPLEGMVILPTSLTSNSSFCPGNSARNLVGNEEWPLKFVIPLMNLDLRRMAVATVGVPHKDHPSAEFERKYLDPEAEQPPFTPTPSTGQIHQVPIHDYFENGPLYPNVELDDVAIHYRCGDVLMGGNGPFYFPKYEAYAQNISPEARSIGIVTQPFETVEGQQYRTRDKLEESGARCSLMVNGLVDYLQPRFPNAKISIRNEKQETLTLAYSRLVMANQSFGLIPSTFSIFPVIAAFGQGYLTKPDNRMAGSFLRNPFTLDVYKDQPVEVDIGKDKLLYNQVLKKMFDEGLNDEILQWFRDPSMPNPPST